MKLELRLSVPESLPFNYQHELVCSLHRWLPDNDLHDALSLYSLSWLRGHSLVRNERLFFPQGAYWYVSSVNDAVMKDFLVAVLKKPRLSFGMRVTDVRVLEEPVFSDPTAIFHLRSPALVRYSNGDNIEHLRFDNPTAAQVMTETLRRKLRAADMDDNNVHVQFDSSYPAPKTKLVDIKGIKNRANFCPVKISGSPDALLFAWNVGVGHSTGAGFGALC